MNRGDNTIRKMLGVLRGCAGCKNVPSLYKVNPENIDFS